MSKRQYNETQITGTITLQQSISGKATAGSSVTDHNRLFNRDKADQHPIEAITNLRDELDAKLDSDTALPLIEEALRTKAAGLYYDAKKELARKAYWYLTSEIDPNTKMGTKDSVISGPYDLGQGGGGGGGGVTKVTVSFIDWPATVVVGSTVNLSMSWSSVIGDPAEPTGPGTIYVAVNNKQVIVKPNQAQGLVTFDVGPYLTSGNNSIKVTVLDAYGTQGIKVSTINTVSLELTSNFNYNLNFSEAINYTYTPWGNIDKIVHFIVDGVEHGTQTVKSTGEQQTYRITGLNHGSHTLKVYFAAEIDGKEVTSNELFYDLVYYEVGNTTPIIVSAFDDTEDREQYIPFSIPYRVFIWNKNSADIQLLENDVVVKSLTVNFDPQSWEYESDVPAIYHLQIKCGPTTKNFTVHIVESQIQVLPVQENLALALGAQGRNNSEPPEERSTWGYNDIHCTLINFNWSSNGWVRDNDGNTVLRLSGDARATIPYSPFAADFKNYGKTIELEIATSAVMNYSTPIIECLDKTRTDFFEATPTFVDEDTRDNIFTVSLDQATLVEKGLPMGSIVFSYTANGWALNGEIVDLNEYGITLTKRPITDVESDEYILIGDNIRLDHSLTARGFYVTPQIAELRSQQSSLSTQYKEDEHVRLAFVVEKNTENRIIWMYINGIASGAVRYPADDNFRQLEPDIITLGSNDAVLDIYNIRVYDNSLTSKQIVNNWIADTQNSALKAQRYYHNDNYNDKNELVIEKLPSDLPYVIWDVNPMPQSKSDARKGNGRYVDPTDSTRNFTTENVEYKVQGTSSAVYPVKNMRMRPKKSDAWYDDSGDTIKKWPITYPGGIGVDYFTFKVDYASSEGANNVELVRLYNDVAQTAGILIPPQKQNSKIRVGIDGFPIIAFHQDEDGNVAFYSKANFNNDKSNPEVYGFSSAWDGNIYLGDESWETTNNSADEAKFKIPVTPENWTRAFESRYPDDKTPNERVFGTLPSDLARLSAMTTWVASTYRANATGDAIDPVTYTYTDVHMAEDGTYSSETVTKTFDHDTAECRLSKFKAELANWFNVKSTIFYYLFTHLFLMVDSRAKNAFPTYYTSRAVNDGGDRWFWLPYDMDTAIGINNEGKLVFDYSLEDTDTVNGADVFNGQDSVLWCNLRDAFAGEIGQMYSELRAQLLLSYSNVEKMFEDHQGKWSENIFNEDSKNKYVAPLPGDNYLEMLQGSKEQQRKWWLYNRFKYFDSKYTAGDAKSDMIIFRAYVPAGTVKPDITITPYADIYATVTYTNGEAGTVSRRAKRNEPIIIPNPLEPSTAMTDQEVHIFSASQLKSVGDLSGFRPDTVKVGNAIKLQDLKVGDGAVDYENPNLKELTLGSNTLLKSLDVRNCTNLEQTVDVSLCINLEEVYFENTKIKGLTLPDGGNLKHLHLPATLTSLTLKNQPLLTDLVLASTENIESLWLENIPSSSIDAYELVSRMKANSAVRLIGINETYDDPDDFVNLNKIEQFYDLLDTMKGINADGEDTDKAQVTGTINLPRISYADKVRLTARYPEVNINATEVICRVKFMNEQIVHLETNVEAGRTIATPAVPEKAPTTAHVYEFKYWEYTENEETKIWTDETIITTDLVIRAVYEELDRRYTVIFNPLSYVVQVNPRERHVVYNNTFEAPEVLNIPEHVVLNGWYTANGDEWDFENTPIQNDITLFAHWTDDSRPHITAYQVAYNTIGFTATDNLGIAAYAITTTNEEPSEWITIVDSPIEYNGTYIISAAGDYYVWAKDTVDNIVSEPAKITAYNVTVEHAVGSTLYITENETPFETNFAIYNTQLHVEYTLDSHYENAKLYVNGSLAELPADISIQAATSIRLECTPKKYWVTFNMMGKGTQEAPQEITYLEKVNTPAAQFIPGSPSYIIDKWYLEDTFSTEWNFDTDTVEGAMTLYAKWIPYSEPSIFNIEIPAITLDDPDRDARRTIEFFFSQTNIHAVEIDWGDGSPKETHPNGGDVVVSLTHTYDVLEDRSSFYAIKVHSPVDGSNYKMGGGYGAPIFACYTGDLFGRRDSNYVKSIQFAASVSATNFNQYVLDGAGITDLCLTPYIKELPTGFYWNCHHLPENITIPATLVKAHDQAFGGCDSIRTITIPDNVTYLGNSIFEGCTNLESVVLNANTSKLTYLGNRAFTNTKLSHFVIPKSVTTMGYVYNPLITTFQAGNVFRFCTRLNTAGPYGAVDHAGNPVTVEYPDTWTRLPDYFGWDTLEEIVFSQNLEQIGKLAFYNNKLSGVIDLSALTNLELIDEWAFAEPIGTDDPSGHGGISYTHITEIVLPNNLITIGANAFWHHPTLLRLDIPASVRYIGEDICYRCWQLTDVKIRTTSLDSSSRINLTEDAWFRDAGLGNCIIKIPAIILDNPDPAFHKTIYGEEWNYYVSNLYHPLVALDD